MVAKHSPSYEQLRPELEMGGFGSVGSEESVGSRGSVGSGGRGKELVTGDYPPGVHFFFWRKSIRCQSTLTLNSECRKPL